QAILRRHYRTQTKTHLNGRLNGKTERQKTKQHSGRDTAITMTSSISKLRSNPGYSRVRNEWHAGSGRASRTHPPSVRAPTRYKMAKWINRIELVDDFRGIAGGRPQARRRAPLPLQCRYL